jgi:hypothetical protein
MRQWIKMVLLSWALCSALAASDAQAEEKYYATAGKFPMLEIGYNEPENDMVLYATCIAPNTLDIRIGGGFDFGKGEYESISLTLTDGATTSRITGVSVKSPDIEMTGGTMLLTSVGPEGKTMQILASGKPIDFRRDGVKPDKVSLGKSVTGTLKSFIKECATGD